MQELGVDRVVLARENTLDDIRAIHAAVPELGLETFVHGALCISYSGQCFMSGMISERSANRGSCAQSCRKDYVLTDITTREELDRGYLISAKDLGAYDHLAAIAEAGIGCLKVEGRKKKPEYVATVTKAYREFLDRVESGDTTPPTVRRSRAARADLQPRLHRRHVRRSRRARLRHAHPAGQSRASRSATVVGYERGELIVDVSAPIARRRRCRLRSRPNSVGGPTTGFSVTSVRTLAHARDDAPGARDTHARRRRLAGGAHVARAAARERARRAMRRCSPEIRATQVASRRARVRRRRNAAQGRLRRRRRRR